MKHLNSSELRSNMKAVLDGVANGEEVLVTRAGAAPVVIIPLEYLPLIAERSPELAARLKANAGKDVGVDEVSV